MTRKPRPSKSTAQRVRMHSTRWTFASAFHADAGWRPIFLRRSMCPPLLSEVPFPTADNDSNDTAALSDRLALR